MAQYESAPSVERARALVDRLGKLHGRMLVAFGLTLIAASLFESDRRGLLLYEEPTAFAASMPEYSAGRLTYGGWIATVRAPEPRRTTARRFIAGSPDSGRERTVQPTGGGGAPSFAPSGPDGAVGELGSPVTLALMPTGAGPGGGGPFVPGVNFGPSPIGGIPLVPPGPGNPDPPGNPGDPVPPGNPDDPGSGTDPLVPAVPEPSGWILMILGVGLLGAALRRSAAGGRASHAVTGPNRPLRSGADPHPA